MLICEVCFYSSKSRTNKLWRQSRAALCLFQCADSGRRNSDSSDSDVGVDTGAWSALNYGQSPLVEDFQASDSETDLDLYENDCVSELYVSESSVSGLV